MKASEIQAMPRCTTMCRETDEDSQRTRTVRCGRWQGHYPRDEHMTKEDVLLDLYEALARTYGIYDTQELRPTLRGVVIAAQAKAWYNRLVLE